MTTDCTACRSADLFHTPGPVFPTAWLPVASTGLPLAFWVPADPMRAHVLVCSECGMRWSIGWDSRDGMFGGASPFPVEADAVLRTDSRADDVVKAGLEHPGASGLAGQWLEAAPVPPADIVAALGRALAASRGPADTGRCLDWLHTAVARQPGAVKALAGDDTLLALLATLPDRPRPPDAAPAMLPGAMAAVIARIGATLERAAPAAAARLVRLDTPHARRDRALSSLRRYLAGEASGDAVRLAGVDLGERQVAALPLAEPHIDLVLQVLERIRDSDAKRAHPQAWALRRQLGAWLQAGAVPERQRPLVEQALRR